MKKQPPVTGGSFSPRVVILVAVMLVLVAAIVGGVITARQGGGSGAHIATPEHSSSSTPHPKKSSGIETGGSGASTLNPDVSTPVSNEPEPPPAAIWAFEEAFNNADPTIRAQNETPYVTSQYLSENKDTQTPPGSDLTPVVVPSSQRVSISCDVEKLSCDVRTTATFQFERTGTVVNQLTLSHHTVWINTTSGWKVAQEAE